MKRFNCDGINDWSEYSSADTNRLVTSFATPIDPVRETYNESVVDGDSGNPIFIFINNEPILLTVWTSFGSGTSVAEFKDDINQLITDLDQQAGLTNNYQLMEVDLSGFDTLNN